MFRFYLFLLLLISSQSVFAMGGMPVDSEKAVILSGKTAAAFSLETTSGKTETFAQASGGKKTVLFFWATWCPHCHEELERVRQNLDAIKKKGIQVVLVDVGESREQAKAFLKLQEIFLESFIDEDNEVSGLYSVVGLPTLFFIDEKGIVRDMDHEFPTDYESRFQSK